MGIFDIIILVLLVILLFLGLSKGFIKQISSIFSWIIAFIVPLLFTNGVMNLFVAEENQDFFTSAIVFASLFVGTFIIVRIIGKVFSKAVNKTPLTIFDKVLGGTWGLIKGLIIISLAFLLLQWLVNAPFIGDGLNDFLTAHLQLDTDTMTIARFLYENNLITLTLEKFRQEPLETFSFIVYNI